MHEANRLDNLEKEKSVLARVVFNDSPPEDDPLEELYRLATTAGTEVVEELVQQRARPDKTTLLGKGKVAELKELVDQTDADLVIFDNNLTPAQTRNLEQAVECKVIDRTELILDIFAAGARSHEARLAVELAQLEYSLPRLKRMWTHLSRQKMGVGARGPGEKQLETDRRLALKRIHDLKQELRQVEHRRERQVASRDGVATVSLVGYTNAGKSTLMNALTGAGVEAADRLFATLDTRTRRWELKGWGIVLLSDTVGFIRDLPHSLVASFKSTLEETRQAALLLHVADASSPVVFDQIASVYNVLQELGIEEKDTLLVLNKIDAIRSTAVLNRVLDRYPHAIPVSAKSGKGLGPLAEAVGRALSENFLDLEVEVSSSDGKLLAYLAAQGEILSQSYSDESVTLHVRLPAAAMGMVRQRALSIRPLALPSPPSTDPDSPNAATTPAITPEAESPGPRDDVPPTETVRAQQGSDDLGSVVHDATDEVG
ncbi:MAG: GTPase HflX [Planctomycetaceae bacterium]|nr:MAG: GTPase HflX [Planctomycetaceae bacterium]